MEGGGGLVVESGRRAAPYLLRSQRWEEAAILLEQVIQRDNSPSTLAMAIPLLRQIVEETKGTREGLENEVVLANTLQEAGRFGEAEESLRHVIEACLADGNYRLASSSGTHLLSLMISTGRLVNSLSLAKEVAGYTRQAGLGPWTQLSDESQRLQILAAMGKYEEVLEELSALEERMASITDEEEREETVKSWNVREGLLVIGCSAALGLERWETALELNAANVDIKIQRNADILEIARARFEDYFPLLRLGRIPEARELLDICKEVFEAVQAVRDIGGVYSALADLEDEDGHSQAAANFEQSALRYNYQGGIPEACASSHNNLSNYLRNIEASPTDVLAHRLAAALLRLQIRSGGLITTIKNLANLALPAERPSFDEVVASVEQVDGVRFRELFSRLPVHAPDGDAALELIWGLVEEELARRREEEQQQQKVLESMPEPVRAAFALDGEEFSAALEESLAGMDPEEAERVLAQLQESGLINRGAGGDAVLDERDQLQQFEPLLGAIAAVARGNPEGKPEIEAALNDLEEGGWHLKGPVERLWGGERDATSLIDGLDDQDTRLVLRMLELVALPSVEEQLAELPEPMRSALEAGDSEALQAAIDALPEEDAQAVIELLDRVFPSDEAEEEELDEAQILEELDPLLLAVAEVARGRDELREDVELALTELAEAGWLLTGAVRRIWAGERDARALTAEVDPGSAPLVLRILELLEKPSPDEVLAAMPPEVQAAFELDGDAFSAAFEAAMEALPPEQAQEILLALRDAGLVSGGPPPQDDLGELFERFDPLIEALVEIARGDESSRAEAETVLRDLEEKGWMLLEPARQIWAGERDAQKLTAGLDEQDKTLVLRALQKLSE
jgi:tetratricopeptide (TPR) repeat protein